MFKVVQVVICVIFVLFIKESQCRRVHLKHHAKPETFDDADKIVGGNDTDIKEVPYQAYLLLQKGGDYYQCGGSILNAQNVLTAAHCLKGIEKVTVRIGSSSNQQGKQYTTRTFFIHPMYNAKTSDYDVGIIKVPYMNLDGVMARSVQLPPMNAELPLNTELLVSGWGTTSENGQTSSNLMAVKVFTVSLDECNKVYNNQITKNMICAGYPGGGKDSCQGDSGGPAVTKDKIQHGVVSFGIGCARDGVPGVYTKVSAVRFWIKIMSGV